MGFQGQTAEAWEFIDAIRSKKVHTTGSGFCVRSLFLAPLGTPFDRLLRASNIFGTQKSALGARCDFGLETGSPKSGFA